MHILYMYMCVHTCTYLVLVLGCGRPDQTRTDNQSEPHCTAKHNRKSVAGCTHTHTHTIHMYTYVHLQQDWAYQVYWFCPWDLSGDCWIFHWLEHHVILLLTLQSPNWNYRSTFCVYMYDTLLKVNTYTVYMYMYSKRTQCAQLA